LHREGATALTATCRVEPDGTLTLLRMTMLKRTYTCPFAPAGNVAPVTLKPSGGVSATDPSDIPDEEVLVRAKS
jgi:hypothetical protein